MLVGCNLNGKEVRFYEVILRELHVSDNENGYVSMKKCDIDFIAL